MDVKLQEHQIYINLQPANPGSPENLSIFRFGAWSIRTVYCSFSIPSLRLWIACGMGFRWWSPVRPWWLCFGAPELEKGSEGLKVLRIETYSNYTGRRYRSVQFEETFFEGWPSPKSQGVLREGLLFHDPTLLDLLKKHPDFFKHLFVP